SNGSARTSGGGTLARVGTGTGAFKGTIPRSCHSLRSGREDAKGSCPTTWLCGRNGSQPPGTRKKLAGKETESPRIQSLCQQASSACQAAGYRSFRTAKLLGNFLSRLPFQIAKNDNCAVLFP